VGGLGQQANWSEGELEALARHVVLSAEAALVAFRCIVGQNASAEEHWE
jgi:hypothetical protein